LSHLAGFIKGNSPEKMLSQEEMKAYILNDITVSDEDLHLLAQARAANVKNHLGQYPDFLTPSTA
jgi:hypothetical protein